MARKRFVSEGETDWEDTPNKKVNNGCNSFESFTPEQQGGITDELKEASVDDPILAIQWSSEWLDIPGNRLIQQQVTEFLKEHGGTDTKNSGFLFHFKTGGDIITARDDMREAIPDAFHHSIRTVHLMNAIFADNHLPLQPIPIPMADAWIIFKTAVLETDYKSDEQFFTI